MYGITHTGECLEDQWAILYILYEISLKYTDLYIRIKDVNGDILLIGGAEYIPDWMEPENSGNRAWLNNGKLLIIPSDFQGEVSLTTEQANDYIKSYVLSTKHMVSSATSINTLSNSETNTNGAKETKVVSPLLSTSKKLNEFFFEDEKLNQVAIVDNIKNYPEQALSNIHRSKVYLPRKLAYILHKHPQLIASAVRLLDQEEAQGSEYHNKKNSNSTNDDELEYIKLDQSTKDSRTNYDENDIVPVVVTFTKMIYAQYVMNPSSPPTWFSAFVPEEGSSTEEGTNLVDSYEASVLGAKITKTMDLLIKESRDKDEKKVKKEADNEDENEDDYSDDTLFKLRLEENKASVDALEYLKNSHKESLEEELFSKFAQRNKVMLKEDSVDIYKLYYENGHEKIVLPTDDEIKNVWDSTVDSNRWLYEMYEKGGEEEQEEEFNPDPDNLENQMGGLMDRIKKILEEEDNDYEIDESDSDYEDEEGENKNNNNGDYDKGYEDDQTADKSKKQSFYTAASSSTLRQEYTNDRQKKGNNDKGETTTTTAATKDEEEEKEVKIDEDDFFEFFLKEALKLKPEEIESYRATNIDEDKPQSNTNKKSKGNKDRRSRKEANIKSDQLNKEDEDQYNNNDTKVNTIIIKKDEDEGFNNSFDEDEFEDELLRQELELSGILSSEEEDGDERQKNYESLVNLMSSLSSPGGLSGPAAATFLSQQQQESGNKNNNNKGKLKKGLPRIEEIEALSGFINKN